MNAVSESSCSHQCPRIARATVVYSETQPACCIKFRDRITMNG